MIGHSGPGDKQGGGSSLVLSGRLRRLLVALLLTSAFGPAGCADLSSTAPPGEHEAERVEALETQLSELTPINLRTGGKLRLVATTSIVADVVKNVGGESIEVITLIPPGADPHTFQPSPGDLRSLTDADVIVINGLGLEDFLYDTLAQVADEVPIVSLSVGITPIQYSEDEAIEQGANHEDEHPLGDDPHVWFDPLNIMIWVENAELAFGTLDVDNHDRYLENARQYMDEVEELHRWIEEMVAGVPAQNRELVTDHLVFRYFARRYGFQMVGAVIPAYSTSAEPSARDLAELKDAIKAADVQALFVGMTVNTGLAELVAEDAGVDFVPLYTGSLSDPGGPADTYMRFMRYDVTAIVQALGG